MTTSQPEQHTDMSRQWITSRVRPLRGSIRGALIKRRDDGHSWITYRDYRRGKKVIIEMPDNAPTRTCDTGRHQHCPHRLGAPAEGGNEIVGRYYRIFHWRCGCPCHRDPQQLGWLF